MKAVQDIGFRRMKKLVLFGEKYMKKLVQERFPPPSSPGQAPHKRTGVLYSSVQGKVVRTHGKVVGIVHATALKRGRPYPLFLETGTEDVKERPFIAPTMEAMESQVSSTMVAPFNNAEYNYLKKRSRMLHDLGNIRIQEPRMVIRI